MSYFRVKNTPGDGRWGEGEGRERRGRNEAEPRKGRGPDPCGGQKLRGRQTRGGRTVRAMARCDVSTQLNQWNTERKRSTDAYGFCSRVPDLNRA